VSGAGAIAGVKPLPFSIRPVALFAVVSALAGCGQQSNLPMENDAAIALAATQALAGCTAALTETGDIDEAALTAAGWRPVSRTASAIVTENNTTGMRDRTVPPATRTELDDRRSYETSRWSHAGIAARVEIFRNGGPFSERMMDECSLPLRGDDGTAANVAELLVRRLGPSTATGIRPAGGDWLTPRWFEPEIRVRYWRRPQHDVYWVSSAEDHVTLEVVAMPDRAALDRWSTSRPEAKFYAGGAAQ
jgi:hypothetical protein